MSMAVGLYPEKLQSWIEGKLVLEYFFLETQLLEVYYILFSLPLSLSCWVLVILQFKQALWTLLSVILSFLHVCSDMMLCITVSQH